MKNLGRLEGRLFAKDGRLHMVIDADKKSDLARISCRIDEKQEVFEMSLGEVTRRISAGADVALDGLNEEKKARLVRKPDGWFFPAREGLQGPFNSSEEAERHLEQHILGVQSRI